MGYSLKQFESEIANLQPRPFDIYILPVFLAGFAIKAKKPMGKLARRMLFGAGVYMLYRNYSHYKKAALTVSTLVKEQTQNATPQNA